MGMQKDWKKGRETCFYTYAHSSIIYNSQKVEGVHQQMDGQAKCGVYMQWNSIQP